jgi:hypothetical protein
MPVECVAEDPVSTNDYGLILDLPALSADWNIIRADKGSMEYNEAQRDTDAGPVLDITVDFLIPFEEKLNHRRLNRMLRQRYMVVVFTTTGLIKWLGTKDNPVSITQSFKSGKRRDGNSSASRLSFVWSCSDKPLQVFHEVVFDITI